jgi:hypothetical protein
MAVFDTFDSIAALYNEGNSALIFERKKEDNAI